MCIRDRYCHFPKDEEKGYDTYYFSGLLSERLEQTRTKTGVKWAWVKLPGHNRNEALDCRNYANAGFAIINPDMFALQQRLLDLPEKEKPPPEKKQIQSAPKTRLKPVASRVYDEW